MILVPDLRTRMEAHVERGELPGIVALVRRGDEVQVETVGTMTAGGVDAMRRDTLFRLASMTKPVTAVATLSLVEEGKLTLDEPVDRLLPELANRRVLRRLDGPLDDTVPTRRSITARDLLTFRMGFGIVIGPSDLPIQRAEEELCLGAIGRPHPGTRPAPDEWIRRFATLPLMHHPGEVWQYHAGSEVLSVLLARAAGKPLDAVFWERVFEPLGMRDTSFWVPEAAIDRLPPSYAARAPFDPDASGFDLSDPARGGNWSRPRRFPSGGSGLVSTADDFLAFANMLLGRGTLGGVRVLSPASVEAMTTDHLTSAQKAAGALTPGYWDTHGWGFGVAIDTWPDEFTGVAGRYGWDGGHGTSWRTDPARGVRELPLWTISVRDRRADPADEELPLQSLSQDEWEHVHDVRACVHQGLARAIGRRRGHDLRAQPRLDDGVLQALRQRRPASDAGLRTGRVRCRPSR
jgi:CubicO group peptidase (beta-lactamase class C family)